MKRWLLLLIITAILVRPQMAAGQKYVATLFNQQMGVWDVDVNAQGDRWVILRKRAQFELDVRLVGISKPVVVELPDTVTQAGFMSDGISVVTHHLGSNTYKTSDSFRLWRWNAQSMTYEEEARGEGESLGFATSPKKKEILAGMPGGIVRWDGVSEEVVTLFKGKPQYTEILCKPVYSSDGSTIITGATGKLIFWDFEAKTRAEAVRTEDIVGRPYAFSYSPEGKYLALSLQGNDTRSTSLKVRRLGEEDALIASMDVADIWIQHLAWHGDWLVCAGGRHYFGTANRSRKASVPYMVMWNVITDEKLRFKAPSRQYMQQQEKQGLLPYREHKDTIMSIAISKPQKVVLTASVDGVVNVWNLPVDDGHVVQTP